MNSDTLSLLQRQALAQQLAEALQGAGNVYALLDALFQYEHEPKFVSNVENKLGQVHNLMAHIPGAEPEFSPLLVALPIEPELRTHFIETALALCNGQPMLSFIRSSLPLDKLNEHLAHYTEAVVLPERITFVLRSADARIIPLLFKLLTEEQKFILMGPIEQWISVDRAGQLQTWTGGNNQQVAPKPPELSPEQVDFLVTSTLPDELLRQFAELFDLTLLSPLPSARHQKVVQWLEQARQEGITDDQELSNYCLEQANRLINP